MAIPTDDELDQQERQRRLSAQSTTLPAPIGRPIAPVDAAMPKPIGPVISASGTPPATEPPAIAASQPPVDTQGMIGPAIQPAAPRPAGQRLQEMVAAGKPQYHGLKRVADTIAGATNIGSAIEAAGGFGTRGYEANVERTAGEAGQEESQIKAAGAERQAEATTEAERQRAGHEAAQTATEQAGAELVPNPAGGAEIMRKNLATPSTAIINTQGREAVAAANNTSKEKIANNTKHETLDQLAAQAIQEKDQDTVNAITRMKSAIAAAGKQEAGNFVPVNDSGGNTIGFVDPKSRDWVPMSSIASGAPGQAAGGPGGTIPPKPNQNIVQQAQSAKGDIEYAKLYMSSGKFTGPGDELLMERFFDLAKPSTGFRMSQPQINMLMGARSWMDSAEGLAYHASTGQWFPPTQRQQIVDAMSMEAQAKQNVAPTGGGAVTPAGGGALQIDRDANGRIIGVH